VQAWKFWSPELGLRALKPFVEFQQPDGRMPHMVFWGRKVSALSNPPFLAWAVYELLQYHPDPKWAVFFLDPLTRFMEWRKKARFDEPSGLYFWIHSYESGIDNSPRFTTIDEKEDLGTNRLGAIDLNAEIILQHQSVLQIINRFTPEHPYKPILLAELKRLSRQIQTSLWDKEKGLFGDLEFDSGKLRTIDTIASYFPLICEDLDPTIKSKMITALRDPQRYNTLIPLPSVARNSPDFVKDMWRGPVWINTAYLVVKGLEKQGEHKLAGEFAYRLCKGVYETYHNEGNFFEFYDPERYDLTELNRKKGNLYKKITLGSKPVKNFAGWTADVNALLFENVFGIKMREGQWILEPHLPEEWFTQSNLMIINLPAFGIDLGMQISKDHKSITIDGNVKEKSVHFSINNHERCMLLDR
jgi:hypothetical protein